MSDTTVLERIKERDAYETDQWQPIFKEAKTDQRYVSGDPWEPADKLARKAAARPCVSLDELGQYYNQVINDVRANPIGVKFSPQGNGANDDTARFYENKEREIEYRSNAQIAFTCAFENTIQQSFGWVRVYTDYEHPRSPNQDLCIGHIPNPLMVRADSSATMPDSSDMRYLLFSEMWSIPEFKRVFGKSAKIQDFGNEAMKQAPNWINADQVKLCEYWELDTFARQLAIFKTPDGQNLQGWFTDEIPNGPPQGFTFVREETRDDTRVMSYLTNGLEVLKTETWKGKYIPFASCYGKVLWIDEGSGAKRLILSMTRLARDAYMAYCFYRTSELELVGMTTKNPYWAYEGQLSNGQMVEIQKSLHEPVAVLLSKAQIPELPGQLIPLPTRNLFTADIQAFSVGAEEMRRAIQAAMGISPQPTEVQRRNDISGEAWKQRERVGQRGSFHFKDHYKDMVKRVGVINEDLITHIYDTARTTMVRDVKGDSIDVRLNDPNDPKSIPTDGDHMVTVSEGPSYDSERDAASDFADTLLTSTKDPRVFALIAPLIVKLKNLGPIGDELVELLEILQPPEARALKEVQKQDPAQTAHMLMQAKAENDQLKQQLQKAAQAIQSKIPELQAKMQEAAVAAASRVHVAEINAQARTDAEAIKAASAEEIAGVRTDIETLRLIVEEIRADKSMAHDVAMGHLSHEQGKELSALAPVEQAEA